MAESLEKFTQTRVNFSNLPWLRTFITSPPVALLHKINTHLYLSRHNFIKQILFTCFSTLSHSQRNDNKNIKIEENKILGKQQ